VILGKAGVGAAEIEWRHRPALPRLRPHLRAVPGRWVRARRLLLIPLASLSIATARVQLVVGSLQCQRDAAAGKFDLSQSSKSSNLTIAIVS
jgi:hypothetical protein